MDDKIYSFDSKCFLDEYAKKIEIKREEVELKLEPIWRIYYDQVISKNFPPEKAFCFSCQRSTEKYLTMCPRCAGPKIYRLIPLPKTKKKKLVKISYVSFFGHFETKLPEDRIKALEKEEAEYNNELYRKTLFKL